MSRAEEIICGRCPQQEHCDYIKINRRSKCTYAGYFAEGYEQAEKDFMEKAKQWFMEHANIAQEIETNEDG